ncbi:MAG: hypothetical protein C4523_00580 [Myxococcales bacterium]|nr:MAG: hypothetical protein C4523_00580 [Myxococcales bacterium]
MAKKKPNRPRTAQAGQKPQAQPASAPLPLTPAAGVALPVSPTPWRKRLGQAAAIGLPVLLFLILKGYSTAPFAGDENIYFYVGKRTAEGVVPYRELFLAHPPFHLLIAALWMLPGYLGPWQLKLASVLPAAGALALLLVAALRFRVGAIPALIVGLALVGSQDFLSGSTHFTGANWSLLLVAAGLVAVAVERRKTGGALLASAALVSFHVIPAVAGIALGELLASRKKAIPTILMLAGVTFGVHFLSLIVFGDPYYKQVFGYHMGKTPMADAGEATVIRFFHYEYPLVLLAVGGTIAWLAALWRARLGQGAPPHRAYTLAVPAAVLQIAAVMSADRVFGYYNAPLLPLFAILGFFFLDCGSRRLGDAVAAWRAGHPMRRRLIAIGVVAALLAAGAAGGEALERGLGYWNKEVGKTTAYEWRDSPALPSWLNVAVKAVFFRSDRKVGDVHLGITRYLWHEFVSENPIVLLPDFEAATDAPGTVFGDASTAPFFALATGRAIALEMADTNVQIFKSGLMTIPDLLSRLKAAPPTFIVGSPRRGLYTAPAFYEWVLADYREIARREMAKGKWLILYRRQAATP